MRLLAGLAQVLPDVEDSVVLIGPLSPFPRPRSLFGQAKDATGGDRAAEALQDQIACRLRYDQIFARRQHPSGRVLGEACRAPTRAH